MLVVPARYAVVGLWRVALDGTIVDGVVERLDTPRFAGEWTGASRTTHGITSCPIERKCVQIQKKPEGWDPIQKPSLPS